MAGMGLDLAAGAGAGADTLQQIIKQRYLEAEQGRQRRIEDESRRRQVALDTENTRRWDLTHQRALATDQSLANGRAAEAERDRAAALKEVARTQGIQGLIDSPDTPPALKRLLQLNQHGVANVGIHDVERPDEHTAHTRADNEFKSESAFADFRRRADYSESIRSQRPIRGALRLAPGQDDPGLPFGSQRYIAAIRQKHGTFETALGELNAYLADPRTQQDHPGLSPQRAVQALRMAYTGAGKSTDDDDLSDVPATVQQAANRVIQRGTGNAPSARTTGDAAPGEVVTTQELQTIAARRGTTVEQERARATAAGYTVR